MFFGQVFFLSIGKLSCRREIFPIVKIGYQRTVSQRPNSIYTSNRQSGHSYYSALAMPTIFGRTSWSRPRVQCQGPR